MEPETPETPALRSRRALLAAAAGSAAALAASTALPLAAAAAPVNVQTEVDNPSSANTSITDNGAGSTAFAGNATGTGAGYGLLGTSTGGGGVVGWSVAPPTSYWPDFDPAFTQYTGVFGSSPTFPDPNLLATGVWGDSPDIGVYGSGGYGVYGYGGHGVHGLANSLAGSVGVMAIAPTNSQTALRVTGKVAFNRAGRTSIGSGKSSVTVSMSGVSARSRLFATLASNRSGRWVRAVVPGTNSFTIYLNTTVTSSTAVAYMVLDY